MWSMSSIRDTAEKTTCSPDLPVYSIICSIMYSLDLVGLVASHISLYFNTRFSPISSPCGGPLAKQGLFSNHAVIFPNLK